MFYKYIPTADIERYRELLHRASHPKIASLVIGVLYRIERVLGFKLFMELPEQLAEYASDPDTQRALRITSRLLKTGDLKSSFTRRAHHPDEPSSFISMITIDTGHLSNLGWSGKSVNLYSQQPTFWPALGEALERMCTIRPHVSESEMINSSYTDLARPKVDIFNCAGLSDEQRCKYDNQVYKLTFDEQSEFCWIPTTDANSQKTIYAPLQWFSFSHINEKVTRKANSKNLEPLLNAPITTGAAAGQTRDDAVLSGLLEVIERDAFMIYWLNQLPASRLNLETIENQEIQDLITIAKDYRLETHVLCLKTDAPVHTLGLVTLDRTGVGPAVMVTAKTGFDIETMICDMLHDSLGQRSGARDMYENHNLSERQLTPAFLEHKGRMVYWHNKKQIQKIEHFVSGEYIDMTSLNEYNLTTTTDKLQSLLTWCTKKDYQVLYREVISPRLKRLTEGLSVVIVKVPQMQPLYLEETLRSTKGERLWEVPTELGYPTPAQTADPFHTEPHPFP